VGEAEPAAPEKEGRGRAPFRAIFESELPTVWHVLRRLGVHERDLEDQVHETFLVVHRRLSEYDPSRPLRPWVLGIAYRRAADYRRLARHKREALDVLHEHEPTDASPGADERLAVSEDIALLQRALETLAPERREVIVLHDLEGMLMSDIAELVGVPVATGYSRLRVGREDLAKAVHRLRLREKRP
jgi:RNA polymerase sigma-70 factor (ECF subfamily)